MINYPPRSMNIPIRMLWDALLKRCMLSVSMLRIFTHRVGIPLCMLRDACIETFVTEMHVNYTSSWCEARMLKPEGSSNFPKTSCPCVKVNSNLD